MSGFRKILAASGAGFLALAAMAPAAMAQDAKLDTGDTAWMLTATALVLLMTIPGLALFYGGMVRKKNMLAIVMQSFATACLMSVLWVVVGYSLAFTNGGGANAFVGGLDQIFLKKLKPDDLSGTIPTTVFITFQMTFAIITPALITGAFADRMKFSSLLVVLGAWMILVYAPITHWVWGGGFMAKHGVLDFAGGTVVHINAGVAGLVAAIVLGKRQGYGKENMAPHNMGLSFIGASLLWVGWFGFNAGSAVGANSSAGMAMLVTQIAAAVAALAWMFVEWVHHKKPSVLGIVSGAISGLVAITPAAGYVGPGGALAIGILAGLGCYWGAVILKPIFGYDDSLDAFGVHGIGGIIGALLTGVFAVKAIGGTAGALEGNVGQILIQIEGIVGTVVYCGIATFVILKVVDAVMGLRVDARSETVGLDITLHGETLH
jgi:Amt family ammonium transporter